MLGLCFYLTLTPSPIPSTPCTCLSVPSFAPSVSQTLPVFHISSPPVLSSLLREQGTSVPKKGWPIIHEFPFFSLSSFFALLSGHKPPRVCVRGCTSVMSSSLLSLQSLLVMRMCLPATISADSRREESQEQELSSISAHIQTVG